MHPPLYVYFHAIVGFIHQAHHHLILLLWQDTLDVSVDSPIINNQCLPPSCFVILKVSRNETYKAAFLKGGSTLWTPLSSFGSILLAVLSTLGAMCEKPLFHRGPHFDAWAASRSSNPGMNMRSGEAEAVPATATKSPLERVIERPAGNMIGRLVIVWWFGGENVLVWFCIIEVWFGLIVVQEVVCREDTDGTAWEVPPYIGHTLTPKPIHPFTFHWDHFPARQNNECAIHPSFTNPRSPLLLSSGMQAKGSWTQNSHWWWRTQDSKWVVRNAGVGRWPLTQTHKSSNNMSVLVTHWSWRQRWRSLDVVGWIMSCLCRNVVKRSSIPSLYHVRRDGDSGTASQPATVPLGFNNSPPCYNGTAVAVWWVLGTRWSWLRLKYQRQDLLDHFGGESENHVV